MHMYKENEHFHVDIVDTPEFLVRRCPRYMDNERNIEQYFVAKVRAAGGWPVKLTSQGTAGMPDRLVLWQGGKVSFVELKRPGGKPRPLQYRQMDKLVALGFQVHIVSTREGVDRLIEIASGKGR